jgi:O-6-methylguanine DNA methyltransferase
LPPKTKRLRSPIIAPATLETPLGPVYLAFSATGLMALAFAGDDVPSPIASPASPQNEPPKAETLKKWRSQVVQALEDYFAGRPVNFENLPLDLEGSPFHLQVWQELRKIPLGETISYQEMARRLGNPKAARAVGQACGANPIPLIVPCHRVIAANGALGGFSSGLERKRWLLAHEKANAGE